jgi:GNAT superfamily N-acetyltransferase
MATVTTATGEDVRAVSELLGEIEAYYGGDNIPADEGEIRAALFGDRPVATVLLAKDGDEDVGMASYSFLWPAARADTSLFLKELFVRENARRGGVARQLMAAVRETARAAGCTRIEWQADQDNPIALAFYAALGARPHEDKVSTDSADPALAWILDPKLGRTQDPRPEPRGTCDDAQRRATKTYSELWSSTGSPANPP